MANLTNYGENKTLDGITGVTSMYSSTMALAFFTADPTDTGSVTNEYTSNGCARVLLSGLFSAATGTDGTSSNTSIVETATATANWTEITHVGFMESDTESTDDMVEHIALDNPFTVLDTKKFSFAIGDLTVTAA